MNLAEPGSRLRHLLPAMSQDVGWVANRWAERLPLPSAERQRLMCLDYPLWRLEPVAEWLDRLARTPGAAQAPG